MFHVLAAFADALSFHGIDMQGSPLYVHRICHPLHTNHQRIISEDTSTPQASSLSHVRSLSNPPFFKLQVGWSTAMIISTHSTVLFPKITFI